MFEELLKGIPNCGCGMDHACAIESILEGPGVIDQTGGLLAAFASPIVVCDANTRPFAEIVLGNLPPETALFDYSADELLPDEEGIARLEAALGANDIIVGVGAGVINDLCKFVSHKMGLPYAIIATAPSMDGYASTAAAMITDGLKVTYFTHVPRFIVADTDILKNAPIDMIKAGFGDILGKYSALSDWKLSEIVTDEKLCPLVYSLMERSLGQVVSLAEKLLDRDEECIRTLIQALIISGIAMAFADNSRPASGAEHHIAHFFEVVGLLNSTGSMFHGTDVAYATYITALLREKAAEGKSKPSKAAFDYSSWEKEIKRVYGRTAASIIDLQEKAGWHERDLTGRINERWDEIRALLAAHPSSAEIERLLNLAGFNTDGFIDFYGSAPINDALLCAKDLKDRYTLLRLMDDLNLPERVTF